MAQRSPKGGKRPFNDKEDPMRDNLLMIRVFVDRGAIASLAKLASGERRTQQRQTGLILERVADIYRTAPQKLIELGILSAPPQLVQPNQ